MSKHKLLPAPTNRLAALWFLATGLTYCAPLVSPGLFWPAAFVAMFGIPAMLAANVGLLAVALFRKWKRDWVWVAFISLLMGYPFIRASFGTASKSRARMDGPQLHIVSYNTGNFLGPNGGDRRLKIKQDNALEMCKWLAHSHADVLILQEVFNYTPVPEFRILTYLRKSGYKGLSWARLGKTRDTVGSGIAILSRLPLRNAALVHAHSHSNNQIVRADVTWQGHEIRIIDAHLESIGLTYEDMAIRREPTKLWRNIRRTIKKMRKAYIARASQVAAMREVVQQSPLPVLIGGDFNDTPYSYSYWQIRSLLRNGFEHAGRGMGNSYNGKFKFGLRIDHQFYSPLLEPLQVRTLKRIKFSDHLPLEGFYRINPDSGK